MPTAADFDKALPREIGAFRYDPGRHHRRRLPQEHERALGGWEAEWPTLAALIETPGSAVPAMGEVAAGLAVDADALGPKMVPLLATAPFAAAVAGPWRPVGEHVLRGLETPMPILAVVQP